MRQVREHYRWLAWYWVSEDNKPRSLGFWRYAYDHEGD